MRTIIILIVTIIFDIVMLPVLLILSLLRRKHPLGTWRAAHRLISWIFRRMTGLGGTRIKITGLENVPSDTAVLYIGNHRSFFDVFLTFPHTLKPTAYVAHKGIAKIPTIGQWGRILHCQFFDRSDMKASMRMMMNCVQMMKSGESVFIFPEGTRNKNDSELDLLTFHDGSFRPAVKSGCPIIPVAIHNSQSIWEAQYPWVKKTEVELRYGKPIYPKDLDPDTVKEIGGYVRSQIIGMLEQMQ